MANRIFILGAGITGLSAAWKLSEQGYKVNVIEKEKYIGGLSATFKKNGFLLDYGPHKIFTVMDNIMDEINSLYSEEKLLEIEKRSKVRLKGKYLNFPLSFVDIFKGLGLTTGLKCGFGYMWALIKGIFVRSEDKSYEEWVLRRFGRPIYNLVLGPYANKIWGRPDTLHHELAETRIAAPNLMEMVRQMILGQKKDSPIINARVFYYPPKGFGDISEKMKNKITSNKGDVEIGKGIKNIEADKNGIIKKINYTNGKTDTLKKNDIVISTIPLASLSDLLSKYLNEDTKSAIQKLKTKKLILFYLVIDKDRVINDNWLFFPEAKYRFNRIFEQKAFNESMVPSGKTVLCIEITCDESDPIWKGDDDTIYTHIKPQLREAGLIHNDVTDYFSKKISNGYPIYDIDYKRNLDYIMENLLKFSNLYSVGRQGGFSYTGMADSMDIGISTAQFISEKKNKAKEWLAYSQRFYNYIVVD